MRSTSYKKRLEKVMDLNREAAKDVEHLLTEIKYWKIRSERAEEEARRENENYHTAVAQLQESQTEIDHLTAIVSKYRRGESVAPTVTTARSTHIDPNVGAQVGGIVPPAADSIPQDLEVTESEKALIGAIETLGRGIVDTYHTIVPEEERKDKILVPDWTDAEVVRDALQQWISLSEMSITSHLKQFSEWAGESGVSTDLLDKYTASEERAKSFRLKLGVAELQRVEAQANCEVARGEVVEERMRRAEIAGEVNTLRATLEEITSVLRALQDQVTLVELEKMAALRMYRTERSERIRVDQLLVNKNKAVAEYEELLERAIYALQVTRKVIPKAKLVQPVVDLSETFIDEENLIDGPAYTRYDESVSSYALPSAVTDEAE